jgi:transposase
MIYIGIDLHARRFSFSVLDADSQILVEDTLLTSAYNLRAVVAGIPGPKTVVFEETTLAAWAYRELEPFVDRVVVADPLQNRWIAGDEKCNDITAARKLAQLLRGGLVHPVHHPSPERQFFKELVLTYHDTGRELVRFKNKLKAKLRQHGIHCPGSSLYRDRDQWLPRLEASELRCQVCLLWESIDHFSCQKEHLRRELARRAAAFEAIAALQQLPGIGLIRAATFFAVVDTPHRFAHKRKLWTYCGLGIAGRQSDRVAAPKHLTRRGNPRLKDVAKGAALAAIRAESNQFARQYQRLVAQGTAPENARLTVARAMVATMYAMWRDGTPYQPREVELSPNTRPQDATGGAPRPTERRKSDR